MDLIDQLRALSAVIPKQLEHLQTEEGVKHALVLPFINALGYNVFDPTEVTPEFVCDVGVKKGEKVDYVILKDGKPIILFECKGISSPLDVEHASQLYRYFSVTASRFTVLTDGIQYRFFTDLDEPNKMDSKPFLEFSMLDIRDQIVEELKRFTKSGFNLDQNISAASELKYTKEIKRILGDQFISPSDDFVSFFARQVYHGKLTTLVRQQFTDITRRALHQFVSDRISERLKSALAEESSESTVQRRETKDEQIVEPPTAEAPGREVVTTREELEAFYVVKAILRDVVDVKRIYMREAMSHCSVFLDNTNRKPICRFRFNSQKKFIGIIGPNKEEERIPFTDVNDIYALADGLKNTIAQYEQPQGR